MRRPLLLLAATTLLAACGGVDTAQPTAGPDDGARVTTIPVPPVPDGVPVLDAAFGPDGLVLVLGGSTPTLVRGDDPGSWDEVRLTDLSGAGSAELEVRADGSAVVTGSPGRTRPSGTLVQTVSGDDTVTSVLVPPHPGVDRAASYYQDTLLSADGTTLVEVVQRESYLPNSLRTELDGTVLVQTSDTATGQVRASTVVPLGLPDQVGKSSAAVSPDGGTVAVVAGVRSDPAVDDADRVLLVLDAGLAVSETALDDGGQRHDDTSVTVADDGSARVVLTTADGSLRLVEVAPGATTAEDRGSLPPGERDASLNTLGAVPVAGDRLAVVAEGSGRTLRIADPADDGARTEVQLCRPGTPAVSADGTQVAVPDECSGPDTTGDPVVVLVDLA